MNGALRDAPRLGTVFTTPIGFGIRYAILDRNTREQALAAAKGRARHEGHKVLDVVSCVEQPYDGSWIVELAVTAAPSPPEKGR